MPADNTLRTAHLQAGTEPVADPDGGRATPAGISVLERLLADPRQVG